MTTPIDLEIPLEEIKYETDEEYQQLFCRIFRINSDIMSELTDVFDNDHVSKGMDYIFSQTQDDEWWKNLYTKTASIFMTEELNIGLCTLLTFSYLKEFYPLLKYYLSQSKDETELRILKESFMEFYDNNK